ncbi:putative nonaspanin (TM9SF) [Dioscorea sansibarensis]
MAIPPYPISLVILYTVIASLVFNLHLCNGIYFPLIHQKYKYYSKHEEVYAQVNSLTSMASTLSFDYYRLPYCKPKEEIIQSREENLGMLLMGKRIRNSPYRFRMNTSESVYLCTSNPLSKEEANMLVQMSHDLYQTTLILDGLRVLRITGHGDVHIKFKGFPLGYYSTLDFNYHIVNHLKFRILTHSIDVDGALKMEIVGFEVVPCSVKHDHRAISQLQMHDRINHSICESAEHEHQLILENETVSFTYQVEFVEKNELRWSSRWDVYLEDEPEQLRWFSILNSLLTISLLAGFLLFKFSRTLWKELSRGLPLVSQGVTRWWHREPSCYSVLFCVMVANGIQLSCTAAATITFAFIGLVSLISQGDFLIIVSIVFYFFSGIPAGYVSVWLWRRFKGRENCEGWTSVTWSTSYLFNAIIFIIFVIMNMIHLANGSTRAVPASVYWTLLSLWLFISLPCTFIGGLIAASIPSSSSSSSSSSSMSSDLYSNIIQNNNHAGSIKTWFIVLMAGLIPFSTIFIELFFSLSSIWLERGFNDYGLLLLLALLMLTIACSLVSAGIAYRCVCTEDWGWCWKSFLASGSTGLYVFIYSVNYLAIDLRWLNGPASTGIYIGYSLILALCVMLSTGAIGSLAAFSFLQYLSTYAKF